MNPPPLPMPSPPPSPLPSALLPLHPAPHLRRCSPGEPQGRSSCPRLDLPPCGWTSLQRTQRHPGRCLFGVAADGLFVQAAPTLTRWGRDPVRGAARGPLLSPPAVCTSPGSVLPACKLVLTPLRETTRPHFLLPNPISTHRHTRTHTPR